MLWLEESLVNKCLLNILSVKICLSWVLKQILIEVLHNAVFNSFSVECPFIVLYVIADIAILSWWKNLIKPLLHLAHQILYFHSLFFSRNFRLDQFRQLAFHKMLEFFSDGKSFFTFQF